MKLENIILNEIARDKKSPQSLETDIVLLSQVISNYTNLIWGNYGEDMQEVVRVNKFWWSLKFIKIVYFISARGSQNFLVIENFKQKQRD